MATAAQWAGRDRYAGRALQGPVGGSETPAAGWTPPLDVQVCLALGVDPSGDPASWAWTDITSYVYARDGIAIQRGRSDEQSQAGPSSCRLTLNNRDGRFSPRYPFGAYYGSIGRNTSLKVSVRLNPSDPYQTRFVGFVSEWPQKWDPSESDFWVPIQADGILRRITQGEKTLASPMRRAFPGRFSNSIQPIAYWPMEDPEGSTRFASAFPGGHWLKFLGVPTLAQDETLTGSDALPKFPETADGARWLVPEYSDAGQWSVHLAVKYPSGLLDSSRFLSIRTASRSFPYVDVGIDPGTKTLFVTALDEDNNGSSSTGGTYTAAAVEDQWCLLALRCYGSTNFNAQLLDSSGNTLAEATITGAAASAYGVPRSIRVNGGPQSGTAGLFAGHLAVIADSSYTIASEGVAAAKLLSGHAGETASDRVARLCGEENIQVDVAAGDSEAMGAQSADTLVGLLRECEAADEGLLVERVTGELGFDPRSSRYNRAASLTLDYASGHLAPGLDPVDDDQATRNDATVALTSGSFGHFVDEDGPLGVDNVGRYDESVTLNLYEDAQADTHAAWRVHVGTIDELRWPRVTLNLRRNPDLAAAWLATDISHRIDLTNLPNSISYDDVELMLEGYSEWMDSVSWEVALNCSRASVYKVFVLNHPTYGRLDTGGSELALGIDESDATILVATDPGKRVWINSADRPNDFPFYLRLGGEVVEVTDISGTTSPQTFTVTRAVNGVSRSHNAGTRARIARMAAAS